MFEFHIKSADERFYIPENLREYPSQKDCSILLQIMSPYPKTRVSCLGYQLSVVVQSCCLLY